MLMGEIAARVRAANIFYCFALFSLVAIWSSSVVAEGVVTLDEDELTTTHNSISNGGLTVHYVGSTAARGGVPATASVSSGKWYWEQRLDSYASDRTFIGLVAPVGIDWDASNGVTVSDQNGVYYYKGNGSNEVRVGDGSGKVVLSASVPEYGAGDVIGIAYDADIGALWVSKNGTWANGASISEIQSGDTSNAVITGLSGEYVAFFPGGTKSTDSNYIVTFAFASADMDYAIPSGFQAYGAAASTSGGGSGGEGGGSSGDDAVLTGPSSIVYVYDKLGRLTSVQYLASGVQYDYSYDQTGNRTSREIKGLDVPLLQLTDTTVTEGGSLEFNVVLNYPAPMGATVDWNVLGAAEAAATSDYQAGSYILATAGDDYPDSQGGPLAIPEGVVGLKVTVTTTDDAVVEGDEVLYVQLSNPVGVLIDENFDVARGTLVDNDGTGDGTGDGSNTPPTATSFTYYVDLAGGTSKTEFIDILVESGAADQDAGDTLHLVAVPTWASGGFTPTMSQSGNGVNVTIDADTCVSDPNVYATYDFTIADNHGAETTAIMSVRPSNCNRPPVAQDKTYVINFRGDAEYQGDTNIADAIFEPLKDSNIDDDILDESGNVRSGFSIRNFSQTSGPTPRFVQATATDISFVADQCGTYKFGYQVEDNYGVLSENTGVITVSVCGTDPGATRPVAQDDSFSFVIDDTGDGSGPGFGEAWFNPLANDSDADGDPITLDSISLRATALPPISWSWENERLYVAANYCAIYWFDYQISDDDGNVSEASIRVESTANNGANCPQIQQVSFEVKNASVTEGGDLSFEIERTTNVISQQQGTYTFAYYTSDGTAVAGIDYEARGSASSPQSFTFPLGTSNKAFITVPTVNNGVANANKTMNLTLVGSASCQCSFSDATAVGTIIDAGETPPSFSVSDASVTEGGDLVFTVTKAGSVSGSYGVDYETQDGSAAGGGVDYGDRSGTLSFGPSVSSLTISVPTTDDEVFEQAETVFLKLTGSTGGATFTDDTGEGLITNNDGEPFVNVFNGSIAEGDDGTKTVNVTIFLAGGTSQVVTLDYTTINGSAIAGEDYVANSGTATFQPGTYEYTFSVTINGDTAIENDEAFYVDVSNVSNARIASVGDIPNNPSKATRGTITITDDDETYAWNTGSWSSWSSGCGAQTRSRSVTCQSGAGQTVADSYCTSTKPATSDSRTRYSYSWNTGSWSSWSGSCPSTTQTRSRSVNCKRCDGTTVSDSNCSGSKPATSDSRSQTCATYGWVTGSWSAWQGACGSSPAPNQSSSRSVVCKSNSGSTVSDSYCSGSKPATSRSQTCYTYSFVTSAWRNEGNCGANNLQLQTRTVQCRRNPGNTTVSDSQCSGSKPTDWQQVGCSGGGGTQPH